MKTFKRLMILMLAFAFCLSLPLGAWAEDKAVTFADLDVSEQDIVLLFTNDVHGGVSDRALINGTSENCLGYAGIAAIKAASEEQAAATMLIDCGDSIQGSAIDSDSDGQNSLNLMEALGYDLCIPGNHEFDFGVDSFVEKVKKSALTYLCANFTDKDGKPVFDKAYDVREFKVQDQDIKIGFVGISTPETIAKGTPKYFQDEAGDFIYSFQEKKEDLYACTQKAIDACLEEGADYVVILGHMGDQGVEEDWSSLDVIENTKGAVLFLDGHAHSEIPGDIVINDEDQEVTLVSTGTKLNNLGAVKLSFDEDGKLTITSQLINQLTDEEKTSEAFKKMDEEVKKVEAEYDYLEEIFGKSDFDLLIYDKETGNRLVRMQDTNMADFVTDAYYWYAENDPKGEGFEKPDLAIINGGSVRADIKAGDIAYGQILAVLPWATHVTQYKVTGQNIVDALEMGARELPDNECGGFIVGSHLTYDIDASKDTKVVTNDQNMFDSVDGTYADGDYRVCNVKINGEDIDLEKTYNIVINAYYSEQQGDGMTMFKDAEAIVDAEANVIDVDVVCAYLKDAINGQVPEDYADPLGQGRVLVIADADEVEAAKK